MMYFCLLFVVYWLLRWWFVGVVILHFCCVWFVLMVMLFACLLSVCLFIRVVNYVINSVVINFIII